MSLMRRVGVRSAPSLPRATAALGSTLQGRQSWSGGMPPGDPVGHSNVLLYNQNLPASGTFATDPGNFFFLFAAAAAVNCFIFYDQGNIEQLLGIPVGTQIRRVKPWRRIQLVGAGGSNVEFFHGYAFSREDALTIQSTIASISGVVSTTPGIGSGNSPTVHADVALATATGSTIAANAARKLLIVGSLSSNNPVNTQLRVGSAAAVQGIELIAGTSIQLPVSASVGVFNGDANAQTFWYEEIT